MVRGIVVAAAMCAVLGLWACDRSGNATKSGGTQVDTPLLWLGGAGPTGGGPGGPPPPGITVIPNAVIPPGSAPAIGVTFEVAFAEDVALVDFALHGSFWQTANGMLWQVTEGQTYIDTVNITDNVNVTSFSNDLMGGYNAPGYDVVVWTPPRWNTFGSLAYVVFGPAKACNAGGVAVSGLEMEQNAKDEYWSREEVDGKLKTIMQSIHGNCVLHGAENGGVNYVKGANVAAFIRIADQMIKP